MEENMRREKKIRIKGISTLIVEQGKWRQSKGRETNVKKITAKEIKGNIKNKRLSSMIFGNKEPSEYIEDGEYISVEELKKALQKEFNEKQVDEKAMLVVGTKEYLEIDELISDIAKKSGAIKISDIDNPKIKTIDKRQGVLKKDTGEYIDKGPTILGKKTQLPSGLYINKQDIEKELKIAFQKEIEAIVPDKEENKKPEILKVAKKYKVKIAPLLLAMGIAIGSTGIHIDRPKDLSYNVSTKTTEGVVENVSDEKIVDFSLGDSFHVNDGETLYTSAQSASIEEKKPESSKTIGEEFNAENKFEGDYDITGFAITYKGKTISFEENFNNDTNNKANLMDMVENTTKELGVDKNDLKVQIHLGTNNDNTRLGWIDVSDIFFGDEIEEVSNTVEKVAMYEGEIENFEGDTIVLENGATIKIKDENGNLLKSGTKIIGSDGSEYSLDNISEENASGINVKYNVNNINLRAGILPALLAVSLLVKSKKENEKARKEAKYYKFDSDKELKMFIEKFEQDPEKQRALTEKIKGMFIKIHDEARRLTPENEKEIQSKIDGQVEYSNYPQDKTGKINKKIDGESVEIIDEEKEKIADVGMDEKVSATGYVENITGKNKNFGMASIEKIDKEVSPEDRKKGFEKIKNAMSKIKNNTKGR